MAIEIWRRLRFFFRLGWQSWVQDYCCPNCDSPLTTVVGRKWGLMQVRRCYRCSLMFRWPKDSWAWNYRYYQAAYNESIVTDPPTDVDAERVIAWGAGKISLLYDVVKPGATVLDFGCSWGYLADLLRRAGYQVVGFEVSRTRAAYGRRHFGLKILDRYESMRQLPAASIDAIFASHVLEHLPRLDSTLAEFARLLRPQGWLLILVPNCGDGNGHLRAGWKPIVGEKHPMAFDCAFFEHALGGYGFSAKAVTGHDNYPELRKWFAAAPPSGPRGLDELVVLAQRLSADLPATFSPSYPFAAGVASKVA